MKKLFTFALFLGLSSITWAQLVTSEQLMTMKFQQFGNQSYKSIAKSIAEHSTLDKNRAINYSKVVEIPGKSKEELYETARKWVASNFSASNCDIRLMDKEMGCVIVQGYVAGVANKTTLNNIYSVNLRPVLKIDIKEERVRITFTLSSYSVSNTGLTSGLLNPNTHSEDTWDVATHYPFGNGSNVQTSAMACVMTHLCATVFIKTAEQVMKQGMAAAVQEEDEW